MRLRIFLGTAALLSVLAGLLVAPVAGKGSHPVALLGGGSFAGAAWRAELEGPSRKPPAAGVGCLSIALRVSGNISESNECERISSTAPMIQVTSSGRGKEERQIYVVVFSPDTRKLEVSVGRAKPNVIHLRRLSGSVAAKVGVLPFAYWTIPIAGPACVHRVVGLSGGGSKLSDSGNLPCERIEFEL